MIIPKTHLHSRMNKTPLRWKEYFLFFVSTLFLQANDQKIASLVNTIKQLTCLNYTIEQVHESGQIILATSYVNPYHHLTIQDTQGNKLFSQHAATPFWLASRSEGGFAWIKNNSKKIITYHIQKKMRDKSLLKDTIAHDVRVYENGIAVLYKKNTESIPKEFGVYYHSISDDFYWQEFSPVSTLSCLNDNFNSHSMKNSTMNSLLMDKSYLHQTLFITHCQRAELFNNYVNQDSTYMALNHAKNRYILRDKNILLFHDLQEKKDEIISIPQLISIQNPLKDLYFSADDSMLLLFFTHTILGYSLLYKNWSEIIIPEEIVKVHDVSALDRILIQTDDYQIYSLKCIAKSYLEIKHHQLVEAQPF